MKAVVQVYSNHMLAIAAQHRTGVSKSNEKLQSVVVYTGAWLPGLTKGPKLRKAKPIIQFPGTCRFHYGGKGGGGVHALIVVNFRSFSVVGKSRLMIKKSELLLFVTVKILFTINSLEKRKNYSFKTLFTIPLDLKST